MKYTPADDFPYYYDLARHMDCKPLFSSLSTFTFLDTISEEKSGHRYAPDKWSIKQIVGHITDHERIKMFRAFLLSRRVEVALWGYDQNLFVDNSCFDDLTFQDLKTDFFNVRKASISFIEALSENQLQIKGMAKQHEVTLKDFLKSIIGHQEHHLNIIKERYV
ncbi:MAG: DinB family protein [Bacteroidota bacterium]